MEKTFLVKYKKRTEDKNVAWINLRAEDKKELEKKADKKGIEIVDQKINSEWIKNNFQGKIFHCVDGGKKRRYGRLKKVEGDQVVFYYGNNPEGYKNFELKNDVFINSLEDNKIWPKEKDLSKKGNSKMFLG